MNTAHRLGVGVGVFGGAVPQLAQHLAQRRWLGIGFGFLPKCLYALRQLVVGGGENDVPDAFVQGDSPAQRSRIFRKPCRYIDSGRVSAFRIGLPQLCWQPMNGEQHDSRYHIR